MSEQVKDNEVASKKPSKTGEKKVSNQGVQLMSIVLRTMRSTGCILTVWTVGYFKFSVLWVIVGVIFYVVAVEYKKLRAAKKSYAQQAMSNEKEAILARVDELPSWVYFPDVERAEWLNKIIRQMWPFIGEYVINLLRNDIEPVVNSKMPSTLTPFKFVKIDVGDIPPRVGGVKVYVDNVKRDEIIMDLDLTYASDSDITVAVRGFEAGIKDVMLHGLLRIFVKPLVSQIPIAAGFTVFFLNKPVVDFDLTQAANLLDLPLLSSALRTIVEDVIAQILVLPNRIPVQLIKGVDFSELKYPLPQGIIRLAIVAAKDLRRADVSLVGKGKSDPYCRAFVGADTFKTAVIQNTINPLWNETFESLVGRLQRYF